ncbi:MAG: zinc ribbon domain-containing protein [Patescibacteria group bacterium]
MSLIKCPVCDKDVSDKARACPNCGHPFKKMVNFHFGRVFKISSIILVLFLISFGAYYYFSIYAPQKKITNDLEQKNKLLAEQTRLQKSCKNITYEYWVEKVRPLINMDISGSYRGTKGLSPTVPTYRYNNVLKTCISSYKYTENPNTGTSTINEYVIGIPSGKIFLQHSILNGKNGSVANNLIAQGNLIMSCGVGSSDINCQTAASIQVGFDKRKTELFNQ